MVKREAQLARACLWQKRLEHCCKSERVCRLADVAAGRRRAEAEANAAARAEERAKMKEQRALDRAILREALAALEVTCLELARARGAREMALDVQRCRMAEAAWVCRLAAGRSASASEVAGDCYAGAAAARP